ncbi:MAG TPA: RloB family protein [Ktedonobacteraceae bacterium]|nr:RloB family protein [Ktedonobacteraceae bacterium]
MAQNDHPRVRKPSTLERKKPTRQPYDRILVVCEGKKTEPNYFDEIRKQARIPTAHICVLHSQFGTQPSRVVEYAVTQFYQTKAFEKVFAVFDRDDHTSYANAIAKAESLDGKLKNDENKQVIFKAIVSVPSFEIWLLLHYANIQAFSHRDVILHRLRGYITDYEKGKDGIYSLTRGMLAIATERAEHLRNRFSRLPGEEAYTDVDELVGILRTIR